MHLCFDRNNPANWFEFLLWHKNSNKFIWICVLTKEINLINIYRLLITFFQINLLFWQEKSRNWVEFCVLTDKIKWIHLHLCFDRKNPANWFEFWLWHENSDKFIWILVYTKRINLINNYRLLITFFQIKFAFCVLTGKIK